MQSGQPIVCSQMVLEALCYLNHIGKNVYVDLVVFTRIAGTL